MNTYIIINWKAINNQNNEFQSGYSMYLLDCLNDEQLCAKNINQTAVIAHDARESNLNFMMYLSKYLICHFAFTVPPNVRKIDYM